MQSELGLRIDVCTCEGLRGGVPTLLDLLRSMGIQATFFVAMGPDRSGWAILRVVRRPGFLAKMTRTDAIRLYGIRTMLSGTLLPPPLIGSGAPEILKRVRDEGHELGVHGWDHVLWHDSLHRISRDRVRREVRRAFRRYRAILGAPPPCSASPAWMASADSMEVQDELDLRFASDTRGRYPFLPIVRGRELKTPQVPVTLPTLDEALGRQGCTADRYVRDIARRLGGTQVLTMHAEAEGRAHRETARVLLETCLERCSVRPLGKLTALRTELPRCPIRAGAIPGRAGRVSIQSIG